MKHLFNKFTLLKRYKYIGPYLKCDAKDVISYVYLK